MQLIKLALRPPGRHADRARRRSCVDDGYDDAVLVMPGTRNLKPGGTAVRLGRFES